MSAERKAREDGSSVNSAASFRPWHKLPFGWRFASRTLGRRTRFFIDVQIGVGRRVIHVERP